MVSHPALFSASQNLKDLDQFVSSQRKITYDNVGHD